MNNDLISKKQAINFLKTLAYDKDMSDEAATAVCMAWGGIDRMPAVDAEPVRHGRWIPKKVDAIETEFQCSECGRTVECGNDYFGKPTKHVSSTFPYCHCGAKMDSRGE